MRPACVHFCISKAKKCHQPTRASDILLHLKRKSAIHLQGRVNFLTTVGGASRPKKKKKKKKTTTTTQRHLKPHSKRGGPGCVKKCLLHYIVSKNILYTQSIMCLLLRELSRSPCFSRWSRVRGARPTRSCVPSIAAPRAVREARVLKALPWSSGSFRRVLVVIRVL